MLNRAKKVKYIGYEIEANRMEFFYEIDGQKTSVLLMAKRFQFTLDKVNDKIAYYLGYSYLIDIIHMVFPEKVEAMYRPPGKEFWDNMITNVVGEALIRWDAPASILRDIKFEFQGTAPDYEVPLDCTFIDNSCLVPIGGGKDSIVTYELAKKIYKETFTTSVQAPGHNWDEIAPMIKKLKCIEMFDSYENMPLLSSFQPITSGNAIFNYSMIALLVAREFRTSEIIFGNDKSVNNEYEWQGIFINHMFDKTPEYRDRLNKFVSENIVEGYNFSSLIENMTGTEVAKELSKYPEYYEHLCSCNHANIKRYGYNGQCGSCLKCMYTYLCICNAGDKKYANEIFGDMSNHYELMEQLVKDEFRDDCFGDLEECKALIKSLKEEK